MKRFSVGLLLFSLSLISFRLYALAGTDPPSAGETLPDFVLPVPKNADHRTYLGLSAGRATFRIPEIKAAVIIVEIFSMYCPYCQNEAPVVNRLYRKIVSDPGLRDRIKIIGIGAGNSPFEVDIFRKEYDIPFPLFPDVDFAIHKCIGEVRTPYFIAVKIHRDGTHRVIYSKLGGLEKVNQFLQSILDLSGLNKEG
jgi:thiol-disulfide isomerase/thioredoxin